MMRLTIVKRVKRVIRVMPMYHTKKENLLMKMKRMMRLTRVKRVKRVNRLVPTLIPTHIGCERGNNEHIKYFNIDCYSN